MRLMAAQTLAVVHRLMLDFVPRQKILVTSEAQLPDGHFGFRRHHVAAVAGSASVLGIRTVNDIFRRFGQLRPGGGRNSLAATVHNRRGRLICPG